MNGMALDCGCFFYDATKRAWCPTCFAKVEDSKVREGIIPKAMIYYDALFKIANGGGYYGAQAREYKNIAREALGLKPL